jgi:tRNA-splicing ligase RtcB
MTGATYHEIEPAGRMQVPVQVYASQRLAPPVEAIAALERVATLKALAKPVIGLPDLHQKPQLECPSSVSTATHDQIVLGLSSPSPNCGMALACTGLNVADADETTLDALFFTLANQLSMTRQSPMLSSEELIDILLRGAEAIVESFDLEPATLDHIDQRGNALPRDNVDAQAILQAVPRFLHEIGAWDFALVGRGNHFLELQMIDTIHDEEIAQAWGLTNNQLAVMYHADSARLGAYVGRLYAHRQKNTWRGRLYEWRIKLPFHLRAGRPRRVLHRVNYHLLPRRMTPIPAHSAEGQRTLLALQAASNYAYANRLAVLATLRDAIHTVWGQGGPTPMLLWDAPHNSIRRETIEGETLWVHRHNAALAQPPSQVPAGSPFKHTGHPVLLPGMDCTSSYLCVAGEGAVRTLHSVAHGAGHSALRLGLPLNKAATTRVYTYDQGLVEMRPHLSSDGVEEVLAILKAHDIIQPVARLRPLAVLKGSLALKGQA